MSDSNGFYIKDSILVEYRGKESEVVIPDGIRSIGYSAFSRCDLLTSVTIPDSVTSIGDYAFKDCKSLIGVVIPDSVTTIGQGAFVGCDSLVDDSGVFLYKNRLLAFCSSKDNPYVVIPDGTVYIDYCACEYYGRINLEMSIDCPTWNQDYWRCSVHSLLEASGSSIYFRDAEGKKIASVVLSTEDETEPKKKGAILSIKSTEEGFDFAGYDEYFFKLSKTSNKVRVALARLAYPYKISDEMLAVFQSYLKRNSFVAGALLIDEGNIKLLEFLGDRKLLTASSVDKLIEYSHGKENVEITSYLINYKNSLSGKKTSKRKAGLDDFVLDDTPTIDEGLSVADWRKVFKFKYCNGNIIITGYVGNDEIIEVPERIGDRYVVDIAERVFEHINSKSITVKKIVIPGTVTSIKSYTFYAVKKLEVEIKEGVKTIDTKAFVDGRGLTVRLPQSLIEMGKQSCFTPSRGINCIVPEGTYAETVCKEYGYQYSSVEAVPTEELQLPTIKIVSADKSNKPWKKPKAGVHLISRYQGDDINVEFPLEVEGTFIKGIANTAGEAPNNYKKIESITIPEGYEIIGKNAFAGCESLVSITLPSTLKTIDSRAFKGCKALRKITIPEGVITLGNNMFEGCQLDSVDLPSSLSFLPRHWFEGGTVEVLIYRGSELTGGGRIFIDSKEPKTIYSDGTVKLYSIPKHKVKPLKMLDA